jgi:hypothetical protein
MLCLRRKKFVSIRKNTNFDSSQLKKKQKFEIENNRSKKLILKFKKKREK